MPGKILRGALKIIPKNSVLPIVQGTLRGKKWIIGSGVFGYWLGTYELDEQKLFERVVKKGDVVFDIGAHVGFYTLLAAELVGNEGKVFSFEPLPRNIFYLKKHIEINNYKNIKIFEVAVSESSGTASFSASGKTFLGQFSKSGELEVRTIALDDLINSGEILPPDVIKIDVEGAEAAVLKGAVSLLMTHHPHIFIATHGDDAREICRRFVEAFGYRIEPISLGGGGVGSNEFFAHV